MTTRAPSHRTGPRLRPRAGFTLIELLVLTAVMGIVALVAMPMLGTDYEYRLDLVELQIRDTMRYAKTLATTTRQTHGVVFDVAGDRFALVDGTGTTVKDPLTQRGYVIDLLQPGQPKGMDITRARFGSLKAAVFDAQGAPLSGGTVTIVCKGIQRTLSLDAVTGALTSL